jgi:Cupin domain
MKKLDISIVPSESGGTYPRPFNEPCIAQSCQRLARYAGLTQFGVNVTIIEAGAWSSQRHWHSLEDEFVWVLDGELTLVTDAGEEHCAPVTARPSGVVIPMAITWLTNRIRRPGCSKLAHPIRETVAPTRTST